MYSFAKYTIIDWIAFLQVLLIWFYMAYRSGQWIVSEACSKGWLVFGIGMLKAGSQLPRNLIAETKAMVAALQQEDE
ncbi:DUF4752 family protein [Escherichia coli]